MDDYVETAAGLELILERLRGPASGYDLRDDPRVTIEAATMERFLDGMERDYGGAVGWARSAGIEAETLDALRSGLLE